MTGKQWKHLASIVGICGLLTILGGCQKQEETTQTSDDQIIQEPTQQETVSDTQSATTENKFLQISSRCIGCGRCARMAPESFSMQGREAVVVSQTNIDSSDTQWAINGCPVQAIEIVEA